jgi:hypothetical protein
MSSLGSGWGGGLDVVGQGLEEVVESAVALLGLLPVALYPLRHEVEHLGFQVHRASLGLPGAAHQARVLEHLEVLRDGLHGHVVGLGQLAHGGVAGGEPSDDVAPGGIGQRREHPGERIS